MGFLHGDMKKGYKEGQTVKFDCILNKDGKPVAINLRSGLNNASQPQTVAQGCAQGQMMQGWKQGGKQNTSEIDNSCGEIGELTGTIKSFNAKTNYGFITCPEITAAGLGDVFFHSDKKKGYKEGQPVKFDCVMNKDGKPVAMNLRSGLNNAAQPQTVAQGWAQGSVDMAGVMQQMMRAQGSVDMAGVMQQMMQGWKQGGKQNTFEIDRSGGELGEVTGTIKSFDVNQNYGFITCTEVTAAGFGDVFLHGDMKKGFKEGQTVKFDCVLNKDGKPVAINLRSGHGKEKFRWPSIVRTGA